MESFRRAVVAVPQSFTVNGNQVLGRFGKHIAHERHKHLAERTRVHRPEKTPQRIVAGNAMDKRQKLT
jgi:hypothetical protein